MTLVPPVTAIVSPVTVPNADVPVTCVSLVMLTAPVGLVTVIFPVLPAVGFVS